MSYLRYLCSFVHSGVQRILCCVFVLLVIVLCTLCWLFLWIDHGYWQHRQQCDHINRYLRKTNASLTLPCNNMYVVIIGVLN